MLVIFNNMNNVKIFVTVIIILIVGVATTAIVRSKQSGSPVASGKYDTFTQCLKDKGAVFYGAFWCPHCRQQKQMFGSSAKLLPYVECSTPDGKRQTQACIDKKIESYPTWELADGTRLPVESSAGVSLETLAAKTSCELPL
jgi:thiol-disulfide isomerase/thioredoxin